MSIYSEIMTDLDKLPNHSTPHFKDEKADTKKLNTVLSTRALREVGLSVEDWEKYIKWIKTIIVDRLWVRCLRSALEKWLWYMTRLAVKPHLLILWCTPPLFSYSMCFPQRVSQSVVSLHHLHKKCLGYSSKRQVPEHHWRLIP